MSQNRNMVRKRISIWTAIISLLLFFSSFVQMDKVEFTASWEVKTKKNILSITLTQGSLPVNCYVYESSPFTGGLLIKQIENIDKRKFEIELDSRKDVYVCVYKDENNLAAKWVRISKDIK